MLVQVKEAEEKVKAMIAQAEEEKSRLIFNAKKADIIKQAEVEAEKMGTEGLAEAERKVKYEAAEIVAQGKKEAEAVKKLAMEKTAQAAEFLINQFEGAIG